MAGIRGVDRSDPVDAFFARSGLPVSIRTRCWDYVRFRFPNTEVQEAGSQGYCSYTFCVGTDTIVQFRPPAHRLDIDLANSASHVYRTLAPETAYLGSLTGVSEMTQSYPKHETEDGHTNHTDDLAQVPLLHVYSLTRLPGLTLAEFRTSSPREVQTSARRRSLIRDFATFIATGWQHTRAQHIRPDSLTRGKVGDSISWRLELMQTALPVRFAPFVESVIDALPYIEALPWTLTHGDIVPSNVMVDATTPGQLRLCGLLDWAEAEYLPFGVGLYGAEELLGVKATNGGFRYFHDADALRELLWSELFAKIPELRNQRLRHLVRLAENLGMLLWHGIAFDNGKLDRVVEEGKDDEEIARLDLFFSRRMALRDTMPALDNDHYVISQSGELGTSVFKHLTRARKALEKL